MKQELKKKQNNCFFFCGLLIVFANIIIGGEIIKPLCLFWKIGKIVFFKQKCYENAVSKFSEYFSYYFGSSNIFSITNIRYMKKFYCCFPIYYEELNRLDFEHYKLLVNINENEERYFYFRLAMFCRSSVLELKDIIKNDYYNLI